MPHQPGPAAAALASPVLGGPSSAMSAGPNPKNAIQGERISYNWMMLDLPDLLRQAGRRVLPVAPLRDDGWFQPPRAMDGVPAPYSPLTDPAVAVISLQVAASG